MKIQATRPYTDTELKVGISADFDTSQKQLTGIAIITAGLSILDNVTIEIKIDTEEVFSQATPASLFQSTLSVPPSEKFFSLFETRNIIGKKFHIKAKSAVPFADTTFLFELK